MNNNLVIGATLSKQKLGRQEVTIRRCKDDPYIVTFIHIIREATREEYIDYHVREGLEYQLNDGDKYYAFYMD